MHKHGIKAHQTESSRKSALRQKEYFKKGVCDQQRKHKKQQAINLIENPKNDQK